MLCIAVDDLFAKKDDPYGVIPSCIFREPLILHGLVG